MFIKTQLLFVYFKVIEESHYAFDIKKKKHETENSKLKPGYSALKGDHVMDLEILHAQQTVYKRLTSSAAFIFQVE